MRVCVCECVCVSSGVRVYKIGNTLGLYADLTHGNKSITYTHFIFVFFSEGTTSWVSL